MILGIFTSVKTFLILQKSIANILQIMYNSVGKERKNMATINYTLRLDETDKQKAEEVFRTLGLSFASGINIYLKTVGRQQKIPFSLEVNANNERQAKPRLQKAIEDIQEQSVINGTDNMTMEEIDDIIREVRHGRRLRNRKNTGTNETLVKPPPRAGEVARSAGGSGI